jgi:hypothetical protein
MQFDEIGGVLEILQQGFPSFKPDERTILAWVGFLEEFDVRDVRTAAVMLCKGLDPDVNPSFAPTSASLCVLSSQCRRERGEREERARRASEKMLEARTASTRSANADAGRTAREAIANGARLTDILNGIGRDIPGPPRNDYELNEARRKALDAIGEAKPTPPTLNEDDVKRMGGGRAT